MAAAPDWHLDENRNEWYRWRSEDSSYVYQGGDVVAYHQQTFEGNYQETPRSASAYGHSQDESPELVSGLSLLSLGHQAQVGDPDGEGAWPQDPEDRVDQPPVSGDVEEGPADKITEPNAFREGIESRKKLKGSRGDRELLDDRYYIRRPGYEFFKVGVVFRTLWPEPTNAQPDNNTVVTGPLGENIYAKIRWFVVIREGHNACTCLPIQTYQSQGVGKRGVIKSEHSIIHVGSKAPNPKGRENPRNGQEGGMTRAVRVNPVDAVERSMDPMSRVNYGKTYTVEHNVKVFDFGRVHDGSINILRKNFLAVWQLQEQQPDPTPVAYPGPASTATHDYATNLPTSPAAPSYTYQLSNAATGPNFNYQAQYSQWQHYNQGAGYRAQAGGPAYQRPAYLTNYHGAHQEPEGSDQESDPYS